MMNLELANGLFMPQVGFGTYLVDDEKIAIKTIEDALSIGYRKIDTASYYKNEKHIGKVLKQLTQIKRDELFITSKVWNSEQGYDNTLKAFENTLNNLSLEYLDCYLIHWPKPKMTETWKALERLYNEGSVKSIGVCNFTENHLEQLSVKANILPMINQIECHPYLQQKKLVKYCEEKGVLIESWGPLMQGKIFEMKEISLLAKKYNKSVSQIAIKWHLQSNRSAVVKSKDRERMNKNIDVFDFLISEEDMKYIENVLDKGIRVGPDPNEIYKRI